MDVIEKLIVDTIDGHADELIRLGEELYGTGEPGFREFCTSEKVAEFLKKLGFSPRTELAVTGVKASLGKSGVNVAVIGELDGISCPSHEFANPENGISHTCGHHSQLVAMMGTAIAASVSEIKNSLDGNVTFFAVPSEEFTDVEYKNKLVKQGKIKFRGGKSELVRMGEFDDIHIALTHHLHMVDTNEDVLLGYNTTNGFVAKEIKYKGKASHAAISPDKGVNALNAAALGMSALAYQRETFRDTDYVRVHAIITKGGHMVNVVPEEVCLEAQVRAKTMSALQDALKKTDRSFKAGASAIGAHITIKDIPGYLPILETPVPKAMIDAGRALKDEVHIGLRNPLIHNGASTDVGDLSHLMPTLGFTTGGFTGNLHSDTFTVTDKYKMYVLPAKIMALTVYHLLKNEAAEATSIMGMFPQHLTKQEYLEYMEKN